MAIPGISCLSVANFWNKGLDATMKAFLASLLLALAVFSQAAKAQDSQDLVWVQIEAQPSLTAAQASVREYAASLPDVHGFALGAGWYGVLLGPYTREDAARVLQVYRRERAIPRDSYLQVSGRLREQFWPVGENALNRGTVAQAPVSEQVAGTQPSTLPAVEPVIQPATEPQAAAEPAPELAPEPVVYDETPAEARRSEAALTAAERRDLQIALRWAGYYNSTIDGAFGRGTRGAMSAWQLDRGYDPSGVLTTRQRSELMDAYNAPLISVGMRRVADTEAGIEMSMPMGVVAFDRYEPPFAQYNSIDGSGIRVMLISQPGDRATLFGLFDILQTLEIIPIEGPRERKRDSFVIEGMGQDIASYAEAVLEDGEIKGFILVWPGNDEDRRTRVLAAMRDSFQRLPGVLDPTAGGDLVQDVNLVSGLTVRTPRLTRSGFFVDAKGTTVTTTQAVAGCTRITIDDYEARIVAQDAALGVAILAPVQALAPSQFAAFRSNTPRLQSEIAVSGYSFGGVLGAPTLTYGTLEDVRGLGGEETLARMSMQPQEGDAGGPAVTQDGLVIGMLLPRRDSMVQLPDQVNFAARGDAILSFLDSAGVATELVAPLNDLPPPQLARRAGEMTVLVGCWD